MVLHMETISSLNKILQNAFLERVFYVKELVCLKNHFKKEILQTLVQIISFLNNEKLGNFINLTKFVKRPKCYNAKISASVECSGSGFGTKIYGITFNHLDRHWCLFFGALPWGLSLKSMKLWGCHHKCLKVMFSMVLNS